MLAGEIVREAMLRLGAVAGDDELLPSQMNNGLKVLGNMLLALPGMSHWTEVETAVDYTAGENQRIRITTTDAVTITVSSSVGSAGTLLWCCNQVTVICAGYSDRAPKDGARVHIADVYSDNKITYFYRSDIAQWTSALDLTRDAEMPTNADMDQAIIALLAKRMGALDPVTLEDAQRGETRLWARYGKRQQVAVDPILLNTREGRRYQDFPQ